MLYLNEHRNIVINFYVIVFRDMSSGAQLPAKPSSAPAAPHVAVPAALPYRPPASGSLFARPAAAAFAAQYRSVAARKVTNSNFRDPAAQMAELLSRTKKRKQSRRSNKSRRANRR